MKHYLVIIALSLLALNANAALNKWVDSDGTVHYSDTRPSDDVDVQGVRNIAGKDQANATATYSPKTVAEREIEMKKAKQEKEDALKKQAQKDAEMETRKSNCAAARENVRVLENSPRLVTYDANGERTFVDDATRAQRLEESQKTISSSCN